jgi:SAM-dependent methyltransferase
MNAYLESVRSGYNMAAEGYADSWRQPHPWLSEEREQFMARIPAGGSIMDAGCGPGHDVAYFAERGFRVVGIDNSDAMISLARRLHPGLDFRIADIVNGDLPPQSFDAVWAAYVLLHVPLDMQPAALQRLCAVIRAGGVLFVATATAESPEEINKPIAGLKTSSGEELAVPSTRRPGESLLALAGAYGGIEWSKETKPLPDRGGALHFLLRCHTEVHADDRVPSSRG